MKTKKIIQFVGIFLIALAALSACVGSDALLGDAGLSLDQVTADQDLEKATSFNAGETIYFNLEFTSGYEGLETTITWKHGEDILQTDSIQLEREANSLDPLWVSSRLETQVDWSPGEYHCDYFVPDQGTQTIIFTLQ